jgi:hypothetical protein
MTPDFSPTNLGAWYRCDRTSVRQWFLLGLGKYKYLDFTNNSLCGKAWACGEVSDIAKLVADEPRVNFGAADSMVSPADWTRNIRVMAKDTDEAAALIVAAAMGIFHEAAV